MISKNTECQKFIKSNNIIIDFRRWSLIFVFGHFDFFFLFIIYWHFVQIVLYLTLKDKSATDLDCSKILPHFRLGWNKNAQK